MTLKRLVYLVLALLLVAAISLQLWPQWSSTPVTDEGKSTTPANRSPESSVPPGKSESRKPLETKTNSTTSPLEDDTTGDPLRRGLLENVDAIAALSRSSPTSIQHLVTSRRTNPQRVELSPVETEAIAERLSGLRTEYAQAVDMLNTEYSGSLREAIGSGNYRVPPPLDPALPPSAASKRVFAFTNSLMAEAGVKRKDFVYSDVCLQGGKIRASIFMSRRTNVEFYRLRDQVTALRTQLNRRVVLEIESIRQQRKGR